MATNREMFEESLKSGIPYYLRREKGFDGKHKNPVVMVNAFTSNGKYIGHDRMARRMCGMHGVLPYIECPGTMCRLGKSTKDGKWYGWNRHFYHGFGVGDVIKKNSIVAKMIRLNHDVTVETEGDAEFWAAIVSAGQV